MTIHIWITYQFSLSVTSNSSQPHGLQHARLPCPSPTPWACSNSCVWSRWCHPTISSSFVPFSCPQSFPASGSLQMSQFFASGGQSIGASASTSDLPMNIQDWYPLGWTGWISLQSKGLSRVFSNTTVQKQNQLYAYIYPLFFFGFPFHLGYHRTLSTVLRAIRRFSLVTNFILVHSSVLAWRIPGMGNPGGLPSMGSQRVGHDWSNLAAAAASYDFKSMHIWIEVSGERTFQTK